MALGPQTPHLAPTRDSYWSFFNNRDMTLRQEKDWRPKLQGKIQAYILADPIEDSPQCQTNHRPKKKASSNKGPGKTIL